jgi:hypothetical protein
MKRTGASRRCRPSGTFCAQGYARASLGITASQFEYKRVVNSINYAMSIVRNTTHLMQNTTQLTTLLALSNLWMAR